MLVYHVQAPLNQGNSGGGLYTADGDLLAINTWTTEKSVSEGIGFAIAASSLLEIRRRAGAIIVEDYLVMVTEAHLAEGVRKAYGSGTSSKVTPSSHWRT